jgi:hypothetical protein
MSHHDQSARAEPPWSAEPPMMLAVTSMQLADHPLLLCVMPAAYACVVASRHSERAIVSHTPYTMPSSPRLFLSSPPGLESTSMFLLTLPSHRYSGQHVSTSLTLSATGRPGATLTHKVWGGVLPAVVIVMPSSGDSDVLYMPWTN